MAVPTAVLTVVYNGIVTDLTVQVGGMAVGCKIVMAIMGNDYKLNQAPLPTKLPESEISL